MKMNLILLQLITIFAIANSQSQRSTKERITENNEAAETLDANREKRGFVITPLSALPAAAIEPLLPFLRSVIPAPLLSKIAPLLPAAAPVVDASGNAYPLPTALTATAPLVSDREIADAAAQQAAELSAARSAIAASESVLQAYPKNSVLVVATPVSERLQKSGSTRRGPAARVVAVLPSAGSDASQQVLPVAPPVVPNLSAGFLKTPVVSAGVPSQVVAFPSPNPVFVPGYPSAPLLSAGLASPVASFPLPSPYTVVHPSLVRPYQQYKLVSPAAVPIFQG